MIFFNNIFFTRPESAHFTSVRPAYINIKLQNMGTQPKKVWILPAAEMRLKIASFEELFKNSHLKPSCQLLTFLIFQNIIVFCK